MDILILVKFKQPKTRRQPDIRYVGGLGEISYEVPPRIRTDNEKKLLEKYPSLKEQIENKIFIPTILPHKFSYVKSDPPRPPYELPEKNTNSPKIPNSVIESIIPQVKFSNTWGI
jgi:hypothetical protein